METWRNMKNITRCSSDELNHVWGCFIHTIEIQAPLYSYPPVVALRVFRHFQDWSQLFLAIFTMILVGLVTIRKMKAKPLQKAP